MDKNRWVLFPILFMAASIALPMAPPIAKPGLPQIPELPSCTVDQNSQPLLKFGVKRADYNKAILPSMRDLIHLHMSSLTTYKLPFKTFWEVTGLSQLFGNGLPACCDACPTAVCADNIEFKKDPKVDKTYASFTWKMKNGPTGGVKQIHNIVGEVDATMQLPTSLYGGWATLTDQADFDFFLFPGVAGGRP